MFYYYHNFPEYSLTVEIGKRVLKVPDNIGRYTKKKKKLIIENIICWGHLRLNKLDQ